MAGPFATSILASSGCTIGVQLMSLQTVRWTLKRTTFVPGGVSGGMKISRDHVNGFLCSRNTALSSLANSGSLSVYGQRSLRPRCPGSRLWPGTHPSWLDQRPLGKRIGVIAGLRVPLMIILTTVPGTASFGSTAILNVMSSEAGLALAADDAVALFDSANGSSLSCRRRQRCDR